MKTGFDKWFEKEMECVEFREEYKKARAEFLKERKEGTAETFSLAPDGDRDDEEQGA